MTMSQVYRMKRDRRAARRLAFTMLEIMTSVTLALMLMYAVAKIYSRVGSAMNETTSVMGMTNALRNAKHQLTTDLENLTVEPNPPRNSRRGEGFLCYVEGMGGPWSNVFLNHNGYPFSTGDIALDTERYKRYGANADGDHIDNTVGDVDDIVSFTTRAPEGRLFRGRYIEPVYDAAGNIVSGRKGVYESQFAEVIWFVRGTTLYRRVLPIISNELLQKSFEALRLGLINGDLADPNGYDLIVSGVGFYRLYDASVHLETKKDPTGVSSHLNSVLVANSLGDLSNRANRYFYWNSCGKHRDDNGYATYPLNLGGSYGSGSDDFVYGGAATGLNESWYWLRMATLQESASPGFRAGAPYGQHNLANDRNLNIAPTIRILAGGAPWTNYPWNGYQQPLTYSGEAQTSAGPLGAQTIAANNLPTTVAGAVVSSPFIDFWYDPNVWSEVNKETCDLDLKGVTPVVDMIDDGDVMIPPRMQDVVLTNVLSFNVKVWDPKSEAFVDLGSNVNSGANSSALADPNDLRSYGYYARFVYENNGAFYKYGAGSSDVPPAMPALPCVYDTWTEQYQSEYVRDFPDEATGEIADIPLDGTIVPEQLKDYPPPYNTPLKSMQIELRVFDPRSKNIRNATFVVDFSHAGE